MSKYKEVFPVTDKYIFLNNAAESPMNSVFKKALDEYLQIVSIAPHTKPSMRKSVKEKLSDLFGASYEDYALITSTGVGAGIVSSGLLVNKGDNIVIPADEHRNNIFPWLALREKGVEIRFVPVAENGYIDLKDIEKYVDDRTILFAIAAVRFNSGFRVDLKEVSSILHRNGALLFVDAIQGAGVVPINVEEMGIDIMSSAGFKWLLGAPGTGFIYLNEKARALVNPSLPGMFAAKNSNTELIYYDDSRKYETGSLAYSLFYAWEYSLDYIIKTGVNDIHNIIIELTDALIEGFNVRNIKLLSKVDILKNRSAILFFTLENEEANILLEEKLKENNIIIAVRDGKCRISPAFYNTLDEIEVFFRVFDKVIKDVMK